ncbi:MAG: amidohydrolase [Xanthomonadales bacterium]|nr:amidohydrolase [Xanthomonadales bacterium]
MLPLLLAACSGSDQEEAADTIYMGGPIITINDDQPTAEAVAVRDGLIVAVGSVTDMGDFQGQGTVVYDLNGRAMLPGFVDSHGHAGMGGLQALSANLLAPPDGEVTDMASLQRVISDWAAANAAIVSQVNMIIGFGYDNAQLAEVRHPTRQDLDEISTDVPILIVHQSGHLGVANSRALELAGITADTENPAGGVIQRDANGEPNGVLEEYAFFTVLFPMLSSLGEEGLQAFAREGSKLWASFGYTTAHEGRASSAVVDALKKVGAAGDLPIDVVAFPDVLEGREFIAENFSQAYSNRTRVGGCKLTIDGSPQGFTALRDRPYHDPVGDYEDGYSGYAAITEKQLKDAVNYCFEKGLQIIVHSNGEGASDMLIEAFEEARATYGDVGNRPVLIHGQFLREDQVDAFQRLGVFPSLFPMHTFYWGDWHRSHTVGPEAAENISPTGWLVERGMKFGTHHDAPVAFPDSMRVLDATVTRRTRSGYVLGPEHRVDVLTALKAMTIWPAWQHFEEHEKGSIEVGKLADFVILSDDPTAVAPETLADLDVLVTVKEGRVVFDALAQTGQVALANAGLMSGPDQAHQLIDVMYAAMGGQSQPHSH